MPTKSSLKGRLLLSVGLEAGTPWHQAAWIGLSLLVGWLLTPFFAEKLSPQCQSVLEEFIQSIQRNPERARDIRVGASCSPDGRPFSASINLQTLDMTFGLLDRSRVNRRRLGKVVTRLGRAAGVAFFNRVLLQPSTGWHPDTQKGDLALLFHELYHVGQYFTGPVTVVRLVGEQVFSKRFGPLEKEAYAAAHAFGTWLEGQQPDYWPLLSSKGVDRSVPFPRGKSTAVR